MDGDEAPAGDGSPQPDVANTILTEQPDGADKNSATQPLQPTNTVLTGPFRLFDLPRELRDNIYDHILVEEATEPAFKVKTKKSRDHNDENPDRPQTTSFEDALDEVTEASGEHASGLTASVKYYPRTAMLLVDKTVKREYEARAQHAMTLILKDNETYSFQLVTLPERAQIVHWVEIHLILFCHSCPIHTHDTEIQCQAASEVTQHRVWVEHLLKQLPKLRGACIYAYLCNDRYKPEQKQPLPCEKLVAAKVQVLCTLPKAKHLTLYKYAFHEHPKLDGPKRVMFKWPVPEVSKDEGKVESEHSSAPAPNSDDTPMDDAESTGLTEATDPMDESGGGDPMDLVAEDDHVDLSVAANGVALTV